VATLNWYFRPFSDGTFIEIVTGCSVNEQFTDKFELESASFGQCDLVVKSVEANDAGTFICRQQTLDPPGKSAELVVLGSVPQCFTDVDGDYVMPGQLVRMTCNVTYTGVFVPDMIWQDEVGNFLSSFTVTTPTYKQSTLTVTAARPSVGLYRCITYFSSHPVAPPENDVDPATNTPDYRNTWTSSRILVEPGQDCADIKTRIPESESGVYSIVIRGTSQVLQVSCDMTTERGGWTVFQRRQDGSVNFFMDWASYAAGFGSPAGEYWLGNEHISKLTALEPSTLRIDLGDWEGEYRYAQYDEFVLSSASSNYVLALDLTSYTGDAEDSMFESTGYGWTTLDMDNDINSTLNCAEARQGAWWYRTCGCANLNAPYNGTCTNLYRCMFWCGWHGDEYALRFTEMKLRPMGF